MKPSRTVRTPALIAGALVAGALYAATPAHAGDPQDRIPVDVRMDIDIDGRVSQAEFVDYHLTRLYPKLVRAARKADALSEIAEPTEVLFQRLTDRFDAADLDGDGHIPVRGDYVIEKTACETKSDSTMPAPTDLTEGLNPDPGTSKPAPGTLTAVPVTPVVEGVLDELP